jgi:hypothetical protein
VIYRTCGNPCGGSVPRLDRADRTSVVPAAARAQEDEAARRRHDAVLEALAGTFSQVRLGAGTVGHNNFHTDFGIGFGGFKQSGVGREGGVEGLTHYLENKTIIFEETPSTFPG